MVGLFERESIHMRDKGEEQRKRERENPKPELGLDLKNCEIMT